MKPVSELLLITFLVFSCGQKTEDTSSTNPIISINAPCGENASLPFLHEGQDGNLYLSWVEKIDSNRVELKYSQMEGNSWTEPETIAEGSDWFVNWADYPMLAVDSERNMIAHFLAKSSAGTYSYDVNVVLKPKGGSWSERIIPHDDGTPTEHGFVSILPQNDGTFRLAWLDGRNTGSGGHDSSHGVGAMTLRTAVIDLDGNLSSESALDSRVCDCCQTGGAMTPSGALFAYRDRSEVEIRDISFVKLEGQKWSEPAPVGTDNWNIAGCPVNGPRVASNGTTTAVAWFTAAAGQPKVQIAFSEEDTPFAEAIVIDETSPLGRVDVVLLNETTAAVSWLDMDDTATIKYRLVKSNGTMEAPITISKTSESRGSGFPQMAKLNGKLYFAWTMYEKAADSEILMAQVN